MMETTVYPMRTGNHYYIDDMFEARKALVEQFGGSSTIAKEM